jgi:hypothetical protein
VLGVAQRVFLGSDAQETNLALLQPQLRVSFYPPNREYVPLEELVIKMPNHTYQPIFADPATAKKVEDHARLFSLSRPVTSLTVSERQIEIF